jgi:NAD(P)H-dependent flavin oxidoreductase YrpB (nitropropane dioxygenase family)
MMTRAGGWPLGLQFPIAQAPTGSIAGPELCAAVSGAGALGALGLTWTEPDEAARQVRAVRAAVGDLPFLVNFVLHFPSRALNAVLDAGAPVIGFSWGDPTPFVPAVRAAGARLAIQVTHPDGARRACDLGADMLICQGIEAGGHVQSTASLADLLPRVVGAAAGVPVIAAGGIADGAGIARALRAGASAAMLGTRFVATRESRAHLAYKAALVAASGAADTALTVCFDGGWPYAAHRVLRNSTLNAWEAAGCPPTGTRPGEGESVARSTGGEPILRYEDTAPRDGMTGDVAGMCLYAGAGVGEVRDVPPAAALVRRLWEEAVAAGAISQQAGVVNNPPR